MKKLTNIKNMKRFKDFSKVEIAIMLLILAVLVEFAIKFWAGLVISIIALVVALGYMALTKPAKEDSTNNE